MEYQTTLRSTVTLKGVGLHSGQPAVLRILPAPAHSGIRFCRTDLEGSPEIQAHYEQVSNTQLATTLGRGPATISTVEHLLAALSGLGVDNALLEVDGPEVPILDGSAGPFCLAILQVGLETQDKFRPELVLKRKVEVKVNEKWACIEPCDRLEIYCTIDWDHPSIGFQEFKYLEGETPFGDLAGARTFGFLRDVEALKRMGLARGGSLDNAVVLDETSVLNPGGLRFPNEFARHKVLDALGDFKLAGVAMRGKVRLHRAGHDLHAQLLHEIFKDPNNFEWRSEPEAEARNGSRTKKRALAAALVAASV